MNLKLVKKISYWLIIIFLALIAGTVGISALNLPKGFRLYTVLSGSMEPSVPVGSLVLVKPQGEYKEGQVITYKSRSDINNPTPENTTTHRIVEIIEDNDRMQYVTKGDANDVNDSEPISKGQIIGGMIFSIPLAGHIISFAKTQEGLIVLIVIPAVIIVYSEIINIKNELGKVFNKVKEVDDEVDEMMAGKETNKE